MFDNGRIIRCIALAFSIILHAGFAAAWIGWPRSSLTLPLQQVMAINVVMLPSSGSAQAAEQARPENIETPSALPLSDKKPPKEQATPLLPPKSTRRIQSSSMLPAAKALPVKNTLPVKAPLASSATSSDTVETAAITKPTPIITPAQSVPSFLHEETRDDGIESKVLSDKATLQSVDDIQPHNATETGIATKPIFDVVSLHNVPPTYPEEARRNGKEGRVILDVDVTPDGTALDVRIKRSSGYRILDYAARDAVQRWRFIPAQRGLITVSASVVVPIEFQLKQ